MYKESRGDKWFCISIHDPVNHSTILVWPTCSERTDCPVESHSLSDQSMRRKLFSAQAKSNKRKIKGSKLVSKILKSCPKRVVVLDGRFIDIFKIIGVLL